MTLKAVNLNVQYAHYKCQVLLISTITVVIKKLHLFPTFSIIHGETVNKLAIFKVLYGPRFQTSNSTNLILH